MRGGVGVSLERNILGDPGAASRGNGIVGSTLFSGKSLQQARKNPWVPDGLEFLPSDWLLTRSGFLPCP